MQTKADWEDFYMANKTPNQMKTKRIIIGETDRAGCPISAPIARGDCVKTAGAMRWAYRDGSFVLQQFLELGGNSEWVDVECVCI